MIDRPGRKPGAFAGYRYQDAMFPTSRFRRSLSTACRECSPGLAARDYLRILDLAAKQSETGVDLPRWGGSWSGNVPITPTVVADHLAHDLGLLGGDGGHDHNGGFVDVRPITRDQGEDMPLTDLPTCTSP